MSIHFIECLAGDHILTAAKRLIKAALDHGEATTTFNGVTLTARPGDTPESIAYAYDRECEALHRAYINSPEGKAAAAARDAEIADLQEKHDCLMRDLLSLDFSSDVAVLDWICSMQESSERIGVVVCRDDIVSIFARHGLLPNVNTGSAFRESDRDNSYRYIVGQALDCLSRGGGIHGIIHHFTDKWKDRFVRCEKGQCQ